MDQKMKMKIKELGAPLLSSRPIMSIPSLHSVENHYSNDAVEKANENREKHGNSTLGHFLRKDEDDFNFF